MQNYTCQIFNCTGNVIYSSTGLSTDAFPLGGTYQTPDIEQWHMNSNVSCEPVTVRCYVQDICSGCLNEVSSMISELGTVVCGGKLLDCNGNCVILVC